LQLIACLPLAFASLAQAAPTCIPLAGFVRLDPEPPGSCTIAAKYPGNAYIGLLNTCFSVTVRGPLGFVVIGSGHSGLTVEGLLSIGGGATTPAVADEAGVPVRLPDNSGTRQFFTARSAINLAGFNGTLYSADAGVISGAGSTEQLLIAKGDGFWTGAYGAIYPRGNIIGAWGPFNGQVCKP
jgi:hypothetical protein